VTPLVGAEAAEIVFNEHTDEDGATLYQPSDLLSALQREGGDQGKRGQPQEIGLSGTGPAEANSSDSWTGSGLDDRVVCAIEVGDCEYGVFSLPSGETSYCNYALRHS
jgi:hypothetical protein